jgi:hypothetical protein
LRDARAATQMLRRLAGDGEPCEKARSHSDGTTGAVSRKWTDAMVNVDGVLLRSSWGVVTSSRGRATQRASKDSGEDG